MNIVCAVTAENTEALEPHVLVLPEGIAATTLLEATERHPNSIVVAASSDRRNMRAHVLIAGQNQVDYLKIRGDDRSEGVSKEPTELPFCESGELAIGVLICRDIEEITFTQALLKRLRDSSRPVKLLCIPADMHGDWFGSEEVRGFEGAYLALSNNNHTYPVWRARSFVATPEGRRIVTQSTNEPIVAAA